MNDLVDKLRAALGAAYDSEWPHRPTCQMLKPVPEGFPLGGFSCNCDVATIWMNTIEAHRTILEAWESGERVAAKEGHPPGFGRELFGRQQVLKYVLEALAKVYEIEVDQ